MYLTIDCIHDNFTENQNNYRVEQLQKTSLAFNILPWIKIHWILKTLDPIQVMVKFYDLSTSTNIKMIITVLKFTFAQSHF